MTTPQATEPSPTPDTNRTSGVLARRIGEEKLDQSGEKTHPARRWVVERTLGWLSKCRAILVRYDKRPSNYLGLLQLACALIWYRRQWSLANLR